MNSALLNGIKVCGIAAFGLAIVIGGISLGSDSRSADPVAAAAPARYYQENEIPAYPGSIEYTLGDDLRVNGVSTRISYFYTDDSPEKVRDFYVSRLKKEGLRPDVRLTSSNESNVYALNKDRSNQISVTIVAQGDQTVVFPAIIPVSGKLLSSSAAKKNDLIPFSPDALGIMNVSSGTESGAFMTYIEPNFDLLSAVGHIRDTMGKRGWDIEEYKQDQDGSGRSAYVQVRRGTTHMAFNIAKSKGRSGVSVTVNTIESMD